MEKLYLAYKMQANGTSELVPITREEWEGIIAENENLPVEERRCFFHDIISDGGSFDYMIYEAPREMYRKWNSENTNAREKASFAEEYSFFSLDAGVPDNEWLSGIDLVCSRIGTVEDMEENILWYELRNALRDWHPWAEDMLDAFLNGHRYDCTQLISKKYGVSQQTVRKYKRQFNEFVKNFLKGVSFSE